MLKDWIDKEVASGVMRHVIGAIGGAMIAKGLASNEQMKTISDWLTSPQTAGAVLAIIAVIKSGMSKIEAKRDLNTAKATVQVSPYPITGSATNVALVLLLACTLGANAQTNSTIALPGLSQIIPTNAISSNQLNVANNVLDWFAPLIPALSNKVAILDGEATMYKDSKSDYHYGGVLDLQVPINTNGILSMGGGAAYVDDQWFLTLVSTKLTGSGTMPVLGSYTVFAETGAAVPVRTWSLENQSAVGVYKSIDFSKNFSLNLEGGVIKETSLSGVAEFFGASATFKW